ncbi:Fe-S protein assembly chaperone HscA [Pseudoalteromonas sp. SR44-5]|jgi:molecular chaperone HscA|uniref:Chaperone protein HscA homolog n=2 Tax=Pseudoalteromonas TaxID=53246 RepID=A0ABY3FFY9_9GAMM|nr:MULTISPECIES: Fe-S protein assembly chaperone HscA [Pseudoalteromonas]MBB1295726.1 Fe-S protein assembly chaperone HscA [Pseudoalteromonas sp. SR41-4]MBB1303805.1 Fe-S protein assembly chaperone HscA [Pseudoalteromonas sp. SR44-8]MBB1311837.1 Fe-S protein assembly chaperone HscA [Pseudoalteromonas sp. SR41-8]MBB1335945.1 Fe-S protein assembly chaperone HscA [Pseudoalteromonas sp. SR41-6]MBB1344221.1 Fe-S protein assembly chaperone HscA [Pseudoalteromonas sp. SR45-6]|tara:strand:- start:2188 stop:4050 length:1863 start_codon:yes stop_codon:yes gene_type:complete
MALLQIAEPGQSAAPHEHKLAIGIDLGTTNSLVATVQSGEARTLTDVNGAAMLPSVVRYAADGITVGELAAQAATQDPVNTLISVKRFLGKTQAEIEQSYGQLPYDFCQHDGALAITTAAGNISPITASSDILKALKQRAEESFAGQDILGAVITVPAYFDDAQRQSTKDAAELAGINVLRLLNEPTAAAVAYGLDSGQEGIIAVYDLGGGTFDISILRLNQGVFEVLATGGDSSLGGDDFDSLLVDHFKRETGVMTLSPSVLRLFINKAKACKEALSQYAKVNVGLEFDDEKYTVEVTREKFEELAMVLVKKTLRSCRRAVKDAGITNDEVLQVVMVGGSTRMPIVRNQVAEFFNKEPLTSIDPDRVVALGAALQADVLVGNKPDSDMLLLDVLPLSLGLETMGGLVEKIIPRNTTIPVARAQEFTTFKDGQTAMSLHVLQGERELVDDCRSLAKFSLKGIPPMAAGAAHIRVTFKVDADGLLSVSAMEKSTGVQAEIQVKPSFGLSDDQVANMLKESMTNAKDDMQARMLKEQQVEALRVIEALYASLATDSALLAEHELTNLNAEIAKLVTVRETATEPNQIKAAIEKVDNASSKFAELRMDASIKKALQGQSVDNV